MTMLAAFCRSVVGVARWSRRFFGDIGSSWRRNDFVDDWNITAPAIDLRIVFLFVDFAW